MKTQARALIGYIDIIIAVIAMISFTQTPSLLLAEGALFILGVSMIDDDRNGTTE